MAPSDRPVPDTVTDVIRTRLERLDPRVSRDAEHIVQGCLEFLFLIGAEFARVEDPSVGTLSTLRYARIPDSRANEWVERLANLALEFSAEARGGETTFGLLLAMYPTDRPHLPDVGEPE